MNFDGKYFPTWPVSPPTKLKFVLVLQYRKFNFIGLGKIVQKQIDRGMRKKKFFTMM